MGDILTLLSGSIMLERSEPTAIEVIADRRAAATSIKADSHEPNPGIE
jgi:hypothetical protein